MPKKIVRKKVPKKYPNRQDRDITKMSIADIEKTFGKRWANAARKHGKKALSSTSGKFGRHKANLRLAAAHKSKSPARDAASMEKAGKGKKGVKKSMAGARHMHKLAGVRKKVAKYKRKKK